MTDGDKQEKIEFYVIPNKYQRKKRKRNCIKTTLNCFELRSERELQVTILQNNVASSYR